jgi:hydrogenase maturation protease
VTAAVTCLGHRDRGDDAAGPLVGDRLRAAGICLLDCREDPTRLLDELEGLDLLVVVDAARNAAPAGTLLRVEARNEPLPADLRLASTHAFGIGDALEIARALGRGPARVVVHAVAGERFGLGDTPSPAVTAALAPLAERVIAELA